MQEKKHWGKFRRWAGAGVLSLTLMLGQLIPLYADSPTPVPEVSPWSISTLNDGEKYGIFPLEWYYDGTFQKTITADKFNSLMDDTEAKLDKLGLKKKEASVSFKTGDVINRETVITSLYKLLANYELPESFEINGVEPIDYMQQKGIVKGSKAGLQLDQPSTVEQATVMASRLVEYTYDMTGSGAKGIMYKVTNDKNTLYMLGSVHLGTSDMYPMHKTVRDAFKASDDLWVELDLINGDNTYFQEKMVYSDGTTLKEHVSSATYEKLQKVLKKLEIPANAFDNFKPFAVSNSLNSFAYFDNPADIAFATMSGIDNYFLTSAMLMGKPIHELEGIKLQADLFADVPAEQQEKELNALLDVFLTESGTKEIAKYLKQMQLDWVEGDAEGLEKSLTVDDQSADNEMNDRLLGERDKNMAKKLAELLEQEGENTSFVVVGAAHYVVDGMVVDLLKEKGYKVEMVQK